MKKTKKIKVKKIDNNLIEKIEKLEDQLKRSLADYQNLSKRVEQRQGEWRNQAVARIVDKLLDVYDDLSRAEDHLKNKGLSMAVSQFWAVLVSEGVEKIDTKKAEFDPELMDCIQVVAGEKNKVIETMTKGYKLNGYIIRPAKVKVGKGGK